MSTGDYVKAGYAKKCGGNVKSWKRRYFMLKPNGFLYYYPDSQCKAEKGRVDVINMERVCTYEAGIGDKLPDPSSMDRSLVVVTQDRNYTLVFDTQHECREWIGALSKVKDGSEPQKYPDPTYPKNTDLALPTDNTAPPPYSAVVPPTIHEPQGPPMPQPMPQGPPMPQAPPMPQGPPMPQAPPMPMGRPLSHQGPPMPQAPPMPLGRSLSQGPPMPQAPPMPHPQYPPNYTRTAPPPGPYNGPYRPPPQQQYPPPPQRQQYPPPPQRQQYMQPPQVRPPSLTPPMQRSCPPPAPYQSRPYVPGPQPRPPQRPHSAVVQQQSSVNVTVVNLAAPQQRIIYR